MKVRTTQLLATLRLSQRFLDEHAGVLTGISGSTASRALDESVTKLSALAAEQDTHSTNTTGARAQEQKLAQEFRRQWLKPLVKIARANRVNVPQFATIVLPATTANTNQIVARAQGIIDVIAPYKQIFLDHGMPADFVERMQYEGAALVSSSLAKGDSRQSRVKATDSIYKTAKDAVRALGVIDTLVKARLHDSEPLVRAWRDASRVVGGSAKSPSAPVPVTADTVPAAKAA